MTQTCSASAMTCVATTATVAPTMSKFATVVAAVAVPAMVCVEMVSDWRMGQKKCPKIELNLMKCDNHPFCMYIQVTTPVCHASAIMIVGCTATVATTMNNFATTVSGRLLFLQLTDASFSLTGETRGHRGRQSSSIARQYHLNSMLNALSDQF